MLPAIVVASLVGWLALAGPAAESDLEDPLSVVLPDGWTSTLSTTLNSRTWNFAPRSESDRDSEVSVRVQLDYPRPDLANRSARETADALFALKKQLYSDNGIEIAPGPVTDGNIAEIDGFACDFEKPDGGIEETFVGPVKEWILLVTFYHRGAADAELLPAGRSVIASLEFDFGDSLLAQETRVFHDQAGRCAIELPADWHTTETRSGDSTTLSISPEEFEGEEFDVGCSIMVWPSYTKSAPRELAGTDEKIRSGWVAFVGFVKREGERAVTLPMTTDTHGGIEGTIVECSRAPEDGNGPSRHRLNFVAAADDTLIDVTFRASEASWPRYAGLFRRALATLQLNVGRFAFSSSAPNQVTGRFGLGQLLADSLSAHLPSGYVKVIFPAPGSTVGWQSTDDKRRIMIALRDADDPKAFLDAYRSQVPPNWPVEELFKNDLGNGAYEVGFSTTLPNGKSPFSHMLVGSAAPGLVYWLNVTIDADDSEGRDALKPLIESFAKSRPLVSLGADRSITFTAPRIRCRFTPAKGWLETFERSRSVISFFGDDGAATLYVEQLADRCYLEEGDAIEARIDALLRDGGLETLSDKKLSGGQGGQDREVTKIATSASGARTFERSRTIHRFGYAATLTVSIPLAASEKPAAGEKRAAPILASFKVDAPGK